MKKHISIILTVLVMILTIEACGMMNANNTADSNEGSEYCGIQLLF